MGVVNALDWRLDGCVGLAVGMNELDWRLEWAVGPFAGIDVTIQVAASSSS